ncbi:maleylpyruvate isomerase N-terminal domain-containing protein [Gordonia sp. FQ]|uniref:maleylpyruvate isomerase N-terminal domain-containing protein n=1 Tax=Gordonia sp. FQ TaxID=3446634 RepID=UPI003F85F125
MPISTKEIRGWFDGSAAGFRDTIGRLDPARLDDPGLGDWTVRSLLGHTCRAFLTIESYLAAAEGVSIDPESVLDGPIAYFRAAFASVGDPAAVAARGVAAGLDLGDDPVGAALTIADRVGDLVPVLPDDAPLLSPVGPMRLIDYLPTRAFELTVHSLDLTSALGLEPGPDLLRAAPRAIELAAALAEPGRAVTVLRAMTGRDGLAPGFTVLG